VCRSNNEGLARDWLLEACCLSQGPPKINSCHRHVPGLVDTSSYVDFNHTPSTPAPRRHPTPIHDTAHITRIPFHPLPQYCLALSSLSRATHTNPPSTHPLIRTPSTAKSPLGWRARSLKQRRPAPGRSSRSATPTLVRLQPNHIRAHHFSSAIALPLSHARAAADLRSLSSLSPLKPVHVLEMQWMNHDRSRLDCRNRATAIGSEVEGGHVLTGVLS
jgi:hypothetical protein